MRAPIPLRVAPLAWREPVFLWTPFALVVAVGWPPALFFNDPDLQRMALVLSLAVFAIALLSLGAAWALGRAPRTRRVVVMHVLAAATLMALAAPFVLPELLTQAVQPGDGAARFNLAMAAAMAPLALVICLPVALVSGMAFAWIALTRVRIGEGDLIDFHTSSLQPFQ